MPEPLANPIRVLVKGPSTVVWISYMGGPRTDFTFPRVVESVLLHAGHPARVEVRAVPSQLASSLLSNWEEEALAFSPDVIILSYGGYESLHFILPRWLERHANSLRARPGKMRQFYRKRLLRPAWMTLAQLQAWLDTKLDSTIMRWRPRRLAAELRQYIKQVQQVGSPLVLVMDYVAVGPSKKSWFPGMAERCEVYNRLNREMTESVGRDNVRFFPTNDLVTKYANDDRDIAMPDGFHFTPEMHQHIGRALAREILEWAETQPHLQLPGDGRHQAQPVS